MLWLFVFGESYSLSAFSNFYMTGLWNFLSKLSSMKRKWKINFASISFSGGLIINYFNAPDSRSSSFQSLGLPHVMVQVRHFAVEGWGILGRTFAWLARCSPKISSFCLWVSELFFCLQNQKKVRSFDIQSTKRQQEDKNRFAASLKSILATYYVMHKMLWICYPWNN